MDYKIDMEETMYWEDKPLSAYEEELEKRLRDAKEQFQGLVDHLYSSETVDNERINRLVDETCAYLGCKAPITDPNLTRKSKTSPLFAMAVDMTTHHAEEMKKQYAI